MNILKLILAILNLFRIEQASVAKDIPPPTIYGQITSAKIKGLILTAFPQLKNSLDDVFVGRKIYDMTTVAEVKRFLKADGTDRMEYGEDFPKCVDYTRRILGNMTIPGWWSLPKGDIWVKINGGHSVVVMALYDNERDLKKGLYAIEGQNDVIELASEMFEDTEVIVTKW